MPQYIFGKDETVFSGTIFKIHHRKVILPDGRKTTYEYCERPPSVSILAFNEKNELLMIRERRPGFKHNVWFLPAGMMDHPGDTPRKAALRELREESGYAAKKLKLVQKKSPSSKLIWDIYLYAARDLYWNPLPRDPGEEMTTHFVPFKDAVLMALDGTIENEFIAYNIIRFNEMLKRNQFSWV